MTYSTPMAKGVIFFNQDFKKTNHKENTGYRTVYHMMIALVSLPSLVFSALSEDEMTGQIHISMSHSKSKLQST